MSTLDPNHKSFYSTSARKWLHRAQKPTPANDPNLYPVNEIETVILSSRSSYPPPLPHNQVRKWWSDCLTQDAPEFGAALGFIGDFLEESHVVFTHAESMDPTIGSILALGRAADLDSHGTRFVNIAAFASGPAGADLSVGAVTERVMGVEGVEGVGVGVPRIDVAEPVWRGGSTIRQVVFAGGVGRSARPNMAMRTVGGTTIFKQTQLHSPLPGYRNRFAARRLAHIDAGESVHAHVEFNPWYERQFAIVDESGKWRIWDIEGRQSQDARIRKELALEEYTSGRVSSADDDTGKGWGRIVWGGDLFTVLACDRKRVGLFDIRGPQSGRPDNPIPTNSDWIFDLKHGPSFETSGHDVFVLTSTVLTWVDMRQSRKPLMNVFHHRNPGDHTLSMELFATNDTTTTALLHSRFNSLITTHCFASFETPAILGPPRLLQSPIPSNATTPVSFGIAIMPCRLVTQGSCDKVAEKYLNDENLRFFTGFGIGKELGVTQRIYASQDLCKLDSEGNVGFKLVDRLGPGPSTPYIVDHDDEEMEIEMRGLSFEGAEQEEGTEFGNPCIGERLTQTLRNITNLHDIYKYAFIDDTASLRTAAEEDIENSIEGSVRHLKALLEKRAAKGDLGIISLLNLQQPARLYDRLEDFEACICELLAEDALSEYKIKSLIPSSGDNEFLAGRPGAAGVSERVPVQISILPLYNKLLETWVHPLPENTPGGARLRRERLCRMLATEIWLSSIGVHLEPSPQSLPPAPIMPPPVDTLEPPPECLPEPLQRIRTYANVSTRVTLPEGLQSILDKWEIGGDPRDYEHVPDDQQVMSKKRKSHRRKRGAVAARRGDVESWQSQVESHPPALVVNSQPPLKGSAARGSSQRGPSSSQVEVVVMSQVERGRHGGRPVAVRRKKRRTGF